MFSANMRTIPSLIVLILIAITAQAQPAEISGRVTIGKEPAAGVEVMLLGMDPAAISGSPAPPVTATTDGYGRYRLAGIPAGRWKIAAFSPAYYSSSYEQSSLLAGKMLEVREGEIIENADIELVRGAVITGRITDSDGRPVIGEYVRLLREELSGGARRWVSPQLPAVSIFDTDDRGIYRIFGLPEGRYIISAGNSQPSGNPLQGSRYRQTFYPDAAEQSKARVVDLKAGDEAREIDIKLQEFSREDTYTASGRIINAESGEPVPGIRMMAFVWDNSYGMPVTSTQQMSNSKGEFTLQGLSSNKYMLAIYQFSPTGQSEYYADPFFFEINGADVGGLEVRMQRGGTISGVAVIEGADDPAALKSLSRVQVVSQRAERAAGSGSSYRFANISPDGKFTISGIPPGLVRLSAETGMATGFSLLRVEHNGNEAREFTVQPGQPLTGVRLVFAVARGSISGRVMIKGGDLPPGTRLAATISREVAGEQAKPMRPLTIDSRGLFQIGGLSDGTYKIQVRVLSAADGIAAGPAVEQSVMVSGGASREVTIVYDLAQKGRGDEER